MADLNTEIPKFYQPQFTRDVQLLSQKKISYLRPFVMTGSYQGESGEVVKQLGIIKANVGDEDRNADTPNMTTPKDQRWVYPQLVDIGELFSYTDAVRILADLAAPEKEAFVAAMQRSVDADIIMPAFFGTAKTGKAGATSTIFPTGAANNVADTVGSSDEATATGLNTKKLIMGRKLLRKKYVDLNSDEVTVAISGVQEADLLQDIKVTNRDYNGGDPILSDGKLKRWLGFNFVVLEEVPFDPASATTRWVPMWAKSGMHLGAWGEMQADFAKSPTKKFNWQLYIKQMMGATRTEENKVIRIKCADNG